MNMLGNKIVARNLNLTTKSKIFFKAPLALASLGLLSVFFSSCVMTKAQGEELSFKVRRMESEVAKLQKVRHDMEILLNGQVRELIDRIAKLEIHLANLRESFNDGSDKNSELLAEIHNLRGQLEEAQYQYRNLEQEQLSLAQSQEALKKQSKQTYIPPLKEEHLAYAKKLFSANKFDDSIIALEKFIKEYKNDKDSVSQAYYSLGENYRKKAENENDKGQKDTFYKKAVVNYQKIVEMFKVSVLREEALYKMGIILKTIGNIEGAKAAFGELVSSNKNSKRAPEAEKELLSLANE